MSARRSLPWIILVGLGVGLACNKPDFSTPLTAYNSFARAVQKKEFKLAWKSLSAGSRKALEDKAKAISESSGKAVAAEPMSMFFSDSAAAPAVKEVRVLKEEGDQAVLAVVPQEGPAREVRMVKEKEGWKLDVTGLLKD